MNNTTKVCLTILGVAWLAAVVVLALFGQQEAAVALGFAAFFAAVMIGFYL